MALAIALVLLVVGTLLFHFLSPWWFTPIASNWTTMDQTVDITFWVTGIVFVAVNFFMAYAVYRYRHRKGHKAHYEPENKKLEWWLTIGTTIGVAAMLTPGLFVWAQFVRVPTNADIVEVIGQQWHWSYRFPGKDGELGATDSRLVTNENPFGMDPEDAKGRDDVLVSNPELHLPIDRPVKVLLRSKDVLHNFAVAQFRVKMDLVPGTLTYLWFTPTKTGEYEILCQELCGVAHYAMRGRVAVDDQRTFDAWLARFPTFGDTLSVAAADLNAGKALFTPCVACHGDSGQGNVQLNAPKLAGQGAWYVKRQLENFKQGLRGTHKSDLFGMQMIPFAGTLPDETAIRNVAAYIESLPDHAPPSSISGDARRGASLYRTCSACHGDSAQGIAAMNAPRLSHMSDWYLARQLKNFKEGIRGNHLDDYYGNQMVMITGAIADSRAIDDLVSYINTLRPPVVENRTAMTN
jgi:cytochrome c oxidase subunit 2